MSFPASPSVKKLQMRLGESVLKLNVRGIHLNREEIN